MLLVVPREGQTTIARTSGGRASRLSTVLRILFEVQRLFTHINNCFLNNVQLASSTIDDATLVDDAARDRTRMGDSDGGPRPGTPDTGGATVDDAMTRARATAKDLEREHLAVAMRRKQEELKEELRRTTEALRRTETERDTAVKMAESERANAEEAKRTSAKGREELERAMRERDDLRATKRELLDVNDRKDRERAAAQSSIDGYVIALEAATAGKNKAELEARRVNAEAAGALANKRRLESEVKALEEHNAWLKTELEIKTSEILSLTKNSSSETLRLAQELETAQSASRSQTHELSKLKENAATAESRIAELEEELKTAKVEMSRIEANFERELINAQRIADVAKEQVSERDERISEIETTLQSTEAVLMSKKTEFDVAMAEAKHAREQAVKELEEFKSKANESAIVASGSPSHRLPGAERLMAMSPAAGAAALRREGLSATELYTKYVEAEDALRQEREQRNELQEHLDAILADLEQKAPLIAEQREEYERALQSHQVLQTRLQEVESSRYSMETEMNAMIMDKRNHERVLNGYKAQSADLARQVALLLNEVHELKGCPPVPVPPAGDVGGDAQAVITQRLVDFTDIQSLQAKNQEMLFVIRDLSEAQEGKTSDAREEYERNLQELKEQTARQLEELSNKRVQQENIVQAIVRQRDMYKTLYAAASGAGNGEANDASELDSKNSELVAIGAGSGVAMMEANNELVALNKELSHDLEKLKRDSFERIKELQNQVDEHREAAATARGEANAAKSTADFERQRYERLSEQYSASQRDVHALTEKNSGLTRQNATHEEFIRNQSASLRDAEERARNAQTQLSQLESSTQLLRSEHKRLSAIVADADEVKAKLESSRDAALSLSTTREEEHKRTHERLTAEVARLQQDYSRVRSELDIERERGRQQLAAHAAANSELAQRTKTDDDASAKLKADTAAAERRADVAEAKLEMMEITLSKTEEKLRLASRMTSSAETNVIGGSSGGIPAAREQELLQAALKAGEAADAAKAAAEAEKKHTKQFKLLAEQNDSALKEMTKAFEAHKTQSMKEMQALKSECAKLKKEAAEAAKTVEKKLSQAVKDAEDKVSKYENIESELKSAQAEVARAQAATKEAEERAAKAIKDVDDEHKKWREAQNLYEKEAAERKTDASKVASAEATKTKVESELTSAKQEIAKVERELAALRAKVVEEKNELEAAKRAVETKLTEITEQNTRLHNMIEQAKSESATDQEAKDEGEVLRYLRQERDAALAQVSTLTAERNKWQRDAESALKEAESSRERLKNAETDAMGEEKHQSLLAKVEQLNSIEQANSALRAEIDAAKAEIEASRKRENELSAKNKTASDELAKVKASVAEYDTERESLRKEAQRWEQRASQLMGKVGDVDKSEFERVKSELEASVAKFEAELKSANAELKSEAARADKAKNQLAISMKHIQVYNPEKLPILKWRAAQQEREARLNELESGAKSGEDDASAELTKAKEELAAANEKVKEASEKADAAEQALGDVKAEVAQLREALKNAEESAKDAAEAPKPSSTEDATDDTSAAPPTPSSDRFKVMAQKMQAEAMEVTKKLRETEDALAAKQAELATALKEKEAATEKCASLEKDLESAREKLKLTEQLRGALEKKVSTMGSAPAAQPKPVESKPVVAELSAKAQEFVPFAPKVHHHAEEPVTEPMESAESAEPKAKTAAEEKLELQRKMDKLRQELEQKKAAAAGQKRKADDAEEEAKEDALPNKTQKTDETDTPAPPTQQDAATEDDDEEREETADEGEDDEGEDDDDEEEDDNVAEEDDEAEDGELEGDAFVEQLLVEPESGEIVDDDAQRQQRQQRQHQQPSSSTKKPKPDQQTRGAQQQHTSGRKPMNNRQRRRSGRGGRGGRGGKKQA